MQFDALEASRPVLFVKRAEPGTPEKDQLELDIQ